MPVEQTIAPESFNAHMNLKEFKSQFYNVIEVFLITVVIYFLNVGYSADTFPP
jgi:hypothetical protein